MENASHIEAEAVEKVLQSLHGILQMPPHRYSAAKVEGRKAYEIAREGDRASLQPRAVVIHEMRLVNFWGGEHPRALVEVHCGKGTYVRSLAEIIGERVGSCAHASFVLRTQVGPFSVADALTLEELQALAEEGRLIDAAIPAKVALAAYPSITVTAEQARMLSHGTQVPLASGTFHFGQTIVAQDAQGELVAIGEVRGARPQVFQPRTVIAGSE